ncbi:hypothetical protein NEHOM01_1632 [Nematocida homosporus]|uniref:uncharacterized protein n=1 Tax=Nematocida homosporus TaxID=1912981 RepID=UPI00221F7622|nr:uncharacterized protein NEHOM01_1632 [Nematocida homosporus]KAI5186679.1 hypothetical protein NEHOM01_1632 [Nematocida homosporus]
MNYATIDKQSKLLHSNVSGPVAARYQRRQTFGGWAAFLLLIWWCGLLSVDTTTNTDEIPERGVGELFQDLSKQKIKVISDLEKTVRQIWKDQNRSILNSRAASIITKTYPYFARLADPEKWDSFWRNCLDYPAEQQNDAHLYDCMGNVFLNHLSIALDEDVFQKNQPDKAKQAAKQALEDIVYLLKNNGLDLPPNHPFAQVSAERILNIMALGIFTLNIPTENYAAMSRMTTLFRHKFLNACLPPQTTHQLKEFLGELGYGRPQSRAAADPWYYTTTLINPTIVKQIKEPGILNQLLGALNTLIVTHGQQLHQICNAACSEDETDQQIKNGAAKLTSLKSPLVSCKLDCLTDISALTLLTTDQVAKVRKAETLVVILSSEDLPIDFLQACLEWQVIPTDIRFLFSSAVPPSQHETLTSRIERAIKRSKNPRWTLFAVCRVLLGASFQVVMWIIFMFYFKYRIIGLMVGGILYITLGFVLMVMFQDKNSPPYKRKAALTIINITSTIIACISVAGFSVATYNSAIRIDDIILITLIGILVTAHVLVIGLVLRKKGQNLRPPIAQQSMFYFLITGIIVCSICLPGLRLFVSHARFVQLLNTGVGLFIGGTFGILIPFISKSADRKAIEGQNTDAKKHMRIFAVALAIFVISLVVCCVLSEIKHIDLIDHRIQGFFNDLWANVQSNISQRLPFIR